MALSVEQLKQLAALYDQWQAANAREPAAARAAALAHLEREATAQDADFRRAFDVMLEQAGNAGAARAVTRWLPIPDSVRGAAIAASAMDAADVAESVNRSARVTLDELGRPRAQHESGQSVGPYRLIKEIGRGGMGCGLARGACGWAA